MERRHSLLRALANLPAEFSLPVVFGSLHKSECGETAPAELRQIVASGNKKDYLLTRDPKHLMDIAVHLGAFLRAEISVEWQMNQYPRDEIAMLIAEDTDRVKRAVKDAHAFLRKPTRIRGTEYEMH
jgi:hypothetical protein